MYPPRFLCEEAKIKQRTPLKKELCEIGEEAIFDSQPFLIGISLIINRFLDNEQNFHSGLQDKIYLCNLKI